MGGTPILLLTMGAFYPKTSLFLPRLGLKPETSPPSSSLINTVTDTQVPPGIFCFLLF